MSENELSAPLPPSPAKTMSLTRTSFTGVLPSEASPITLSRMASANLVDPNTVIAAVDPTDLKYQVDTAFDPDKEAEWPYPKELDGWFHSHNALRSEIDMFKKAIAGLLSPLEPWQESALRTWMAGHATHVHGHHDNEDKLFNPFLKTRIKYPEKLETDHVGLVRQLEKIEKMMFAPSIDVKALRKEWAAYERLMLPHLREEEAIGLPCAPRHLSIRPPASPEPPPQLSTPPPR